MRRKLFKFVLLGLTLQTAISGCANLGKRHNGTHRPGGEPEANTGATVSEPTSTAAPNAGTVQPPDTGKGISEGRGVATDSGEEKPEDVGKDPEEITAEDIMLVPTPTPTPTTGQKRTKSSS